MGHGVPNTDEQGTESPDDTPVTDEESSSSGRKVLLLSLAAVVAMAVAGVVVYLLTRNDSPGTTAGPSVPTIEGPPAPGGSAPGGSTPQDTPQESASLASAAGDADDVQSVAEQAAKALSSADADTLIQLSCDPSTVTDEDTLPENAKVEVVGEPEVSGDTATVNVRVTVPGVEPAEVPMPLVKQDGRWCIPS
jgi:hypothetical protein